VSGIREKRTAARRAAEKVVRDAAYAIECPDAKSYKGVRKKKCNGTDHPCESCAKKYKEVQDVQN
jgi:hypothetical protein